jgi:predicted transcriptional regulator
MIKKNLKTNSIMESYNTIKILPNIFLSNDYNIDSNFVENNSIKNIILINNINENNINENNINENNNEQSETYNQIYLTINEFNIDFNVNNNMIIDILKKSKNILIISDKNIIGFVIISSFLISTLNISLLQILIMDKFYNIQITNSKYYKLLENYYHLKKILL